MGRYALAGTSLVAAIPAWCLAYVTIMAFVRHTENMPTIMIVVNVLAVLVAVLLGITPVAIVVGRRAEKKEAEPASADAGEEEAVAESAAHTADVVMDEPEEEAFSEEMDVDDMGETAETDEFEFDMDDLEDAASSADDAFEFDDEDELK